MTLLVTSHPINIGYVPLLGSYIIVLSPYRPFVLFFYISPSGCLCSPAKFHSSQNIRTYGFSLLDLNKINALWSCDLITLHRVSLTRFHTVSGHNPYMYWPSLQLICHCLVYNLFGFDFNLRSIEYSILPSSNKTGFFPPLQCMFKPTPAWLHPSYIYKGINGYCILFLPYCHAYSFSLFNLNK